MKKSVAHIPNWAYTYVMSAWKDDDNKPKEKLH